MAVKCFIALCYVQLFPSKEWNNKQKQWLLIFVHWWSFELLHCVSYFCGHSFNMPSLSGSVCLTFYHSFFISFIECIYVWNTGVNVNGLQLLSFLSYILFTFLQIIFFLPLYLISKFQCLFPNVETIYLKRFFFFLDWVNILRQFPNSLCGGVYFVWMFHCQYTFFQCH